MTRSITRWWAQTTDYRIIDDEALAMARAPAASRTTGRGDGVTNF
mgnify:CR=1 FL=1